MNNYMNTGNFFRDKIIIGAGTAVLLIIFILIAVFSIPLTQNRPHVFAQSGTPAPTLAAYPEQIDGSGYPSETAVPIIETEETAVNLQEYPANNEVIAINRTPTPYPPSNESTKQNQGNDESSNVIGDENVRADSNNVNESPDNNMVTLWGGFLITLLVFIAGVIGSALLFTRKK